MPSCQLQKLSSICTEVLGYGKAIVESGQVKRLVLLGLFRVDFWGCWLRCFELLVYIGSGLY